MFQGWVQKCITTKREIDQFSLIVLCGYFILMFQLQLCTYILLLTGDTGTDVIRTDY